MDDERPGSSRGDDRPWRRPVAVAGLALLSFALGFAAATSLHDDTDGGAGTAIPGDLSELEIGSGRGIGALAPLDDRAGVPAELPELDLSVHTDGCGVIRSETPESVPNLTWTFLDGDGFEVLGRNALGETRYRFYRPGAYTVVLEAWNGETYVPVSNEVTIRC